MVNTTGFLSTVKSGVISTVVAEGTHLAVGDDDTTPTAADTALGNELTRKSVQEVTQGTSDVILSLFLNSTESNGNSLKEVGVFDAAASGNMMCRNTFTTITPGYLSRDLKRCIIGHPRFIFSHDIEFGKYFRNRKVIYITRKFFDIIVSYYYYHCYRESGYFRNYSIDDFVMNIFDFKNTIKKINYFSRMLIKSKDHLIISYEELLNDDRANFRRIIDFSSLKYDYASFSEAIIMSKFNSMRKLELKNKKLINEKAFHMRKGRNGEGFKELNEKTRFYIYNILNDKLKGILKKYYIGLDECY